MTVWLVRSGTGQQAQGRINLETDSCPTVMAGGIGGGNTSQYWIEDDGKIMPFGIIDKPPYAVPSMATITTLPDNGYRVISTFSGCGGSCLGYRMAGFRILWANEFVPVAQASYKANAAPGSILDGRDIKHVQPEEILQATGLQRGDLDILDGSPPCQAFSTAGKRHKGWGKEKTYEHGAKQKNETLFDEYIRLLRGLQPKVFVAENVSGLVKGVAKGFFLQILHDLKGSGYKVEARLLDAQWLGVPQMRQRIIFIGIRNDLGLAPAFPKPLPYRYSVREALPWIVSQQQVTGGAWHYHIRRNEPSYSVRAQGIAQLIVEVQIEGANGFNQHAGSFIEQPLPTIQASRPVHDMDGTAPILVASSPQGGPDNDLPVPSRLGRRKLTIAELKRICAFPDDFILLGSYAQQWACLGNAVPPVMMTHVACVIRDEVLMRCSR